MLGTGRRRPASLEATVFVWADKIRHVRLGHIEKIRTNIY